MLNEYGYGEKYGHREKYGLGNVQMFIIEGMDKVYKEFMLYAIGRNINKYHRFIHGELKKFEGKIDEKAA